MGRLCIILLLLCCPSMRGLGGGGPMMMLNKQYYLPLPSLEAVNGRQKLVETPGIESKKLKVKERTRKISEE